MAIPGLYKIFDHWCRQTVWIYSDPHFGDKELTKNIPGRPSDEEHIKLINSCVGRKDTLIILGDIGDIECARKLRGYKILICGNHDVGHTIYEEVFDEVYSGPLMIGEKIILSHEPVDIPWAFNFHGHDHKGTFRPAHKNCCSNVVGYKPINLNSFMKSGPASKVPSIHRIAIDVATKRCEKRKEKIKKEKK